MLGACQLSFSCSISPLVSHNNRVYHNLWNTDSDSYYHSHVVGRCPHYLKQKFSQNWRAASHPPTPQHASLSFLFIVPFLFTVSTYGVPHWLIPSYPFFLSFSYVGEQYYSKHVFYFAFNFFFPPRCISISLHRVSFLPYPALFSLVLLILSLFSLSLIFILSLLPTPISLLTALWLSKAHRPRTIIPHPVYVFSFFVLHLFTAFRSFFFV